MHRIPDLGANIIVRLSIDGGPSVSIAYGHAYERVLPAGRHVLAVAPSPNAKWKTRSKTTLDVRPGETYNLTIMGDGSGGLTLRGG